MSKEEVINKLEELDKIITNYRVIGSERGKNNILE